MNTTTATHPLSDEFQFHFSHVAILLSFFIASRLFLLLNFPIFNDEGIYIQWTQFINRDWDAFKYISVNNVFAAWKPPLMYWLFAPFIRIGDNPLLGARLIAVTASLVGVISVYTLAGYYFRSGKTAFWAAALWTLNPLVIFYDREFVGETFVYSFSAATFLFTYVAISKNRLFALPAAAFGALTLLSKQTGQLSLVNLLFFGMVLFYGKQPAPKSPGKYIKASIIVAIISVSYLIYRLAIPAEYFKDYDAYATTFRLSLMEMLQFPFSMWLANIKMITSLYTAYYTLPAAALIVAFALRCIKNKKIHDLMLLTWFIFNSLVIVLAFKYFNEYVYHTAVIIPLTLILGSSVTDLMDIGKRYSPKALKLTVQYGIVSLLLTLWTYSLFFYYTVPAEYMKRFGTEWTKGNYLTSWPSGFGVTEAVEILKGERNKLLFIDPQWGNPGTALEVYAGSYPTLRIIPLSSRYMSAINALKPDTALLVFRYRPNTWWDSALQSPICKNRTIIRNVEDQLPLIVCRN